MKLLIVTGMSGAGMSTALNILEDEGFYCVDNMPIDLIPKFAELVADGNKKSVALGIDIRAGENLSEMDEVMDYLCQKGYEYKIIYLDASDDVLIKRYKETRRTHPLGKGVRMDSGIELEREQTRFLKEKADYIFDTSQMLTRELKQEISQVVLEKKEYNNLFITVLSFGFKYGIPTDSDLVFDVRFLPNPYYIESLKQLTGNDRPVQEFVTNNPEAKEFMDRLYSMIDFLLPYYVREGKNSLVVAIGCTGGKHRSVTVANALASRLNGQEYGCKVEHRDIKR